MLLKKRSILILIIAATVTLTLSTAKADSFVPAGYQSFYVLGNSTKIITEAVDIALNLNPDTAQPYSVFSLVAYQNKSRIYIDIKDNGYTFNPVDFTGADAVFELERGGVLTLDNWQPPYYSITPAAKGTLIKGNLTGPADAWQGIDGGDFFFIAGGPVNVFRGATDRTQLTGDGNYVAGMWELYPIEQGGPKAQKSYVIPAGENTDDTPDFNTSVSEGRGGTYAVVQSTKDGTVVRYTVQGVLNTRNLGRGDSFVIPHVWENDWIAANEKVQVGLIASGGQTYDIRYYTLRDKRFTGSDFWVPTYPEGYPDMNIRLHVFAVTDANVSILYDGAPVAGWDSRFMAENSTETYLTASDTPLHVVAGSKQRLIILVSMDSGSGARDWGYVPVDSNTLFAEYFIPYAPSGRNTPRDMQLYVCPFYDGTIIFADYDQDGSVDDFVMLDRFQSYAFNDTVDMDNTGTYLFSNFPFKVVYGESPYANIGGTRDGYDWGYTLIPLDITYYRTALSIVKEAEPPIVSRYCNVTFTLTVKTEDRLILDVNVTDELPPGFGYAAGSAMVTFPNGTVSQIEPDVDNLTLSWPLMVDMQPNATLVVEFTSTPSPIPKENYIDTGRATGRDPFNNTYSPESKAFITVSPRGVVLGYVWNVTKAAEPVTGVTVELINCTTGDVYNVSMTDGNGLYKFIDLAEGLYCVRYDPADPSLGNLAPVSDDDPTVPPDEPFTCSANFTLATNCTYAHDFMLAVPVDVYIEKSGPVVAVRGENVTYTIVVGNLGVTDAVNVTVLDSLCGIPTFIAGDTDMDGEVDPGEFWVYSCEYTVGALDPNPLVNTVTVNTTDFDTNSSNNFASWSIDLVEPGLNVVKRRMTPRDGNASVGETVLFSITITNIGNTPIETLPLNDTYNPSKLDYVSATPSPLIADEASGTLLWLDLTGPGSLGAGDSVQVNVTFTGKASTMPGVTRNLARVIQAKLEGFDLYLDGGDSSAVQVYMPLILVEKTLIDPPGEWAHVGDVVMFRVNVTNLGDLPVMTLPLEDQYDPDMLLYLNAVPAPSTVNQAAGLLDWTDLTGMDMLKPGESVDVDIWFETLRATTSQGTTDTAMVIEAEMSDGSLMNGTDTAEVYVYSPVGGTVSQTPLGAAAPLLTAAALIALAAFLSLRREAGVFS